MKSLTKIQLDDETIRRLTEAAGIGFVTEIKPLTAGEFNSVFCVTAENRKYVLKIAPDENAPVLTYEKNMMQQEVEVYGLMNGKTRLKTPAVYYSDFSKQLIPAGFFMMEFINSKTLAEVKPDKEERSRINARLAEFLGELHTVKGAGFGYSQNGLFPDWYEAIKNMVQNLIADTEKKHKKLKGADKLLGYIEKYKDVLLKVEPVLVNFDLWDLNIFYTEKDGGFELSVIDPERSFYGDRIADFVALDFLKTAEQKQYLFESYNKTADTVLTLGFEEKIRYYIMTAYLAMIMQAEKHYRYKKTQLKYWYHSLAAQLFLSDGLKNLKKLSL